MSGTAGKKWEAEPRAALPEKVPSPEELLSALEAAVGPEAWIGGETKAWGKASGSAEKPYRQAWAKVKREGLRAAVKRLIEFHYPHLVVIGATDLGETIELPYVFRMFAGGENTDMLVVVSAVLPKSDPWVDSLADLIPGVVMGEREKQEMMGVVVRNIPDGRRMFLPEDFPKGVYPWRRDETGVQGMTRELWSEGRPEAPVALPSAESQKPQAERQGEQAAPAKEKPVEPVAGEPPALPEGNAAPAT
ncbi:MAG: NADH-quinone oxidoreductase subunit C [Kiritimatiellae bacterium]|nr:NADH-quinone oxidoreductase subunit C [Kiritimatiellia bacterium]